MEKETHDKQLKVEKETVRSILELTESLLKKFPGRVTGSKSCDGTASALAQKMRGFCDTVSEETFTHYPDSFFNMARIVSLTYVVSFLLLILGGIFAYIACALYAVVLVYMVNEYMFFGDLFDRFFKKKAGRNAVGILEPAGEVKQQIYIVSHHDSPYMFSFLSRFGKVAGLRFIGAILFFFFLFILTVIAAASVTLYGHVWQMSGAVLIFLLTGLAFMIPLFFFISTKISPGAGDNLNSSSIAVHIGGFFAGLRKNGTALQHTRLILLSTDAEESGHRGAIEYIRRHKPELLSIPTHVLNIDSVYHLEDLTVLTRDQHGFVPLSKELAGTCVDISAALGYPLKKMPAPFGSSTDAGPFAGIGIDTASLIGMPASMRCKEFIYHTKRDTLDRISPDAVEAVFNIIINYIAQSDQKF